MPATIAASKNRERSNENLPLQTERWQSQDSNGEQDLEYIPPRLAY